MLIQGVAPVYEPRNMFLFSCTFHGNIQDVLFTSVSSFHPAQNLSHMIFQVFYDVVTPHDRSSKTKFKSPPFLFVVLFITSRTQPLFLPRHTASSTKRYHHTHTQIDQAQELMIPKRLLIPPRQFPFISDSFKTHSSWNDDLSLVSASISVERVREVGWLRRSEGCLGHSKVDSQNGCARHQRLDMCLN